MEQDIIEKKRLIIFLIKIICAHLNYSIDIWVLPMRSSLNKKRTNLGEIETVIKLIVYLLENIKENLF